MAVGQRWMIEREAEVILSLPTRNVLWTQFSAAYRKRRDRFYDRKATPRAFLDEASDGPYLSPLFPTHQTQDKRSRMGVWRCAKRWKAESQTQRLIRNGSDS